MAFGYGNLVQFNHRVVGWVIGPVLPRGLDRIQREKTLAVLVAGRVSLFLVRILSEIPGINEVFIGNRPVERARKLADETNGNSEAQGDATDGVLQALRSWLYGGPLENVAVGGLFFGVVVCDFGMDQFLGDARYVGSQLVARSRTVKSQKKHSKSSVHRSGEVVVTVEERSAS